MRRDYFVFHSSEKSTVAQTSVAECTALQPLASRTNITVALLLRLPEINPQRFLEGLQLAHRFAHLVSFLLGPGYSTAFVISLGENSKSVHQPIELNLELPPPSLLPGLHLASLLLDRVEYGSLMELR